MFIVILLTRDTKYHSNASTVKYIKNPYQVHLRQHSLASFMYQYFVETAPAPHRINIIQPVFCIIFLRSFFVLDFAVSVDL